MTESLSTKGERTRQTIMDAAKEIILNQGYTAASVRKIGEAAGITPAAIYNHFQSKEDLFSALLEEAAPLQEAASFFNNIKADSAEELLAAAFRGMVALLEQHEEYIRLALIDAQERDGATLVKFLPRLFPLLMQLLQRMQALDAENGRMRPLPMPTLARAIVSLVGGYLITERVGHPQQTLGLPPLDWVGELLNVLMYGVFHEL